MINRNNDSILQDFAGKNNLTKAQLEDFICYAEMLQEWNNRFNLTALTDPQDIISYHFQDSLEVLKFIDIADCAMIADVGTGAGFPALPLKIMYPHVPFVLIEVNHKKREFLQAVADRLRLSNIEYIADDWRTFLRHTELPIDLFLARASLQPEELLRIYKRDSFYKHARMIYWASQHWQAQKREEVYIKDEKEYTVGGKKRRYILFGPDNSC